MTLPAPPGSAPPPEFRIDVPERRPLGAGKALLVLLIYVLSQVVAGTMVVIAYGMVRGLEALNDLGDLDPVLFLIAGAAGFVIGGPAVFFVAKAMQPGATTQEKLAPLGWVKSRPAHLLWSAGIGVALALVLGYALEVLFPPTRDVQGPLLEAASAPGWQRIIFVVLAVILAPFVEEFLFRGVLFTGMARSWGTWPAAFVVTVLFGFLHITDIAGYLPALGVITLLGFAMLAVRLKTGSLWPAVAMHAGYNGVQVIALYLTV